jgi:Sortase and related acyltransferases
MIRPATSADASAICSIYNHYIENTVITFEEEPLTADEMAERIRAYSDKYAYIVYEKDGVVIGYAYGSSWRTRRAYRFSTETTVYLKDGTAGKGIGALLYAELIVRLKEKGFHSLIGCITLPNEKSVRLHEKMGFKKVAHFHEAGWKFDQWLDVGFWELIV